MARKIYTQNVEVRFKAVDDANEEYDVLVEDQLVGAYNSETNTLFIESVGATATLTGAVMGAVMHQFRLKPEVTH